MLVIGLLLIALAIWVGFSTLAEASKSPETRRLENEAKDAAYERERETDRLRQFEWVRADSRKRRRSDPPADPAMNEVIARLRVQQEKQFRDIEKRRRAG